MPNTLKSQMPRIKRASQKAKRKTVRCSCDADDMSGYQFSQILHECNGDELILKTNFDFEPSRDKPATAKSGALDVTRPFSQNNCPEIASDTIPGQITHQPIVETPKVKPFIPGCSQLSTQNDQVAFVHEVNCKAHGENSLSQLTTQRPEPLFDFQAPFSAQAWWFGSFCTRAEFSNNRGHPSRLPSKTHRRDKCQQLTVI